jgi:hypothetical protein
MSRAAGHTRWMSQSTQPGNWDGPWYRVHTEQFEAAFLPDAHEDLESVNNTDVEVQTKVPYALTVDDR